jgi:hypothetical protein
MVQAPPFDGAETGHSDPGGPASQTWQGVGPESPLLGDTWPPQADKAMTEAKKKKEARTLITGA